MDPKIRLSRKCAPACSLGAHPEPSGGGEGDVGVSGKPANSRDKGCLA